MNTFMMHVGNLIGMCKIYFMNMAKFCGYGYGKFLWVWKKIMDMEKFYGYEILGYGIFLLGV